MQRIVQRALRRGEETSLAQRLSNREYFSPRLLAEEAVRGDSIALQVYSEVGRWLGAAIARYINLFEPDILILAGSILDTNDLLLTHVRNALTTNSSAQEGATVKITPAHLGNEATLIGMAVPFFASNLVSITRPLPSFPDVIEAKTGEQASQSENILDDVYPIHADVINQSIKQRKAKSYQRQIG
jgi:hypothetical protein